MFYPPSFAQLGSVDIRPDSIRKLRKEAPGSEKFPGFRNRQLFPKVRKFLRRL